MQGSQRRVDAESQVYGMKAVQMTASDYSRATGKIGLTLPWCLESRMWLREMTSGDD